MLNANDNLFNRIAAPVERVSSFSRVTIILKLYHKAIFSFITVFLLIWLSLLFNNLIDSNNFSFSVSIVCSYFLTQNTLTCGIIKSEAGERC